MFSGSWVTNLAPIVAVLAAGFTWSISQNTGNIAAEKIAVHNIDGAAHYLSHSSHNANNARQDVELAGIKGMLLRIEEGVNRNKEAANVAREDQREILRLLRSNTSTTD